MTQQELALKLFIKYGWGEFDINDLDDARGTGDRQVHESEPIYATNMIVGGWLSLLSGYYKLNPEKIKEVLDDATRTST